MGRSRGRPRGRAASLGNTFTRKDTYKNRVLNIFQATSPDTSLTNITYFIWHHIFIQPGPVIWAIIHDWLLYGNFPGKTDIMNHLLVAPLARKPKTTFQVSKHDKLGRLLYDHRFCPKRFAKGVSSCIFLGTSERVWSPGAPSFEPPTSIRLTPKLSSNPRLASGSICEDANSLSSSSNTDGTEQILEEELEKANSSTLVAAGTLPPVLPPSVEEAYKKKCIELKRRLTEVEESNDAFRLRKVRLNRAIRKMRLERALLLENLGKRMRKNGSRLNGGFDEDSEGSSDQPPTVYCSARGPKVTPVRTAAKILITF